MALLGKISAVLTASTADFTRKIGAAKSDIKSLQQTVSGVQLNLNTRALDGTLTRLQKFKRTLEEVRRAQAAGNGPFVDTKALEEQFRVFEDIGKPLTDLKNKIEGLSTTMQAGLYPALERVQKGFQDIYRGIGAGSTTLAAQTAQIEAMRTALVRLGRASATASDIGSLTKQMDADNSGASFSQAAAKESLQRTLQLRKQAEQIPAKFRSDIFADLAVSAEDNAGRIERAVARILRVETEIADNGGVATSRQLNERAAAQEAIDSATRRQRVINAQFEREVRGARISQIVSPEASSEVDSLTERFAKLSASLRQSGDTRFDPLIASVGRVISQLNEGAASAKRAKQAVDALASADFAKSFGKAGFESADRMIRTESERTIESIRRGAQSRRNEIIGSNPNLGPKRTSGIASVNVEEDAALAREEFNRTIASRFGGLGERTRSVKDAGIAKSFDDIRKLAADASRTLQSAVDAPDVSTASQRLDNYKAKFESLVASVDRFDKKLASAETAGKRFEQFLTISGSRADKLGADLDRAASDIAVWRQAAGNFDANNQSGRRGVSSAIEKSLDVYKRAAELQQRIFDKEFKNEANRQRAIERTTRVIENQRNALRDIVVAESQGAITRERAQTMADRAAKNRGSFGAPGAAAAQLAFQQALFAVDDLMSSTGGLEYKLRAVGNNITQLGLLLGQSGLIPGLSATTGLFIGLAAVMGGQAVSAMLRWATGAEAADAKVKALNESLSKQKSLADELAQAYRTLGSSLSDKGFSPAAREAAAFKKQLDEIAKKQKEGRDQKILSLDAGVLDARAGVALAKKRLDEAATPGDAVIAQRQLEAAKRREQLASEAALSRQLPAKAIEDSIKSALIREGQARAGQAARSEEGPVAKQMAIQRELAAAEKRAASVAVGGGAADVAKILDEQIKGLIDRGAPKRDIAELQSVLEEVRNKIRVASDESVRTVFQLAGKTTDAIEAATLSIERAGVPQSILGKDVNSIAEKRNEIVNKLEKTTDPAETEALKRQQAALLSQATALLSAARSAEQFAAALDRVAGDLANTVLSETESTATKARRDANAAAARADFDFVQGRIPGSMPNDGRGKERSNQLEARRYQTEDARKRAEEELKFQRRQQAELQRQRTKAVQDFERQAAGGQLGGEVADLVKERDKQQAIKDNEKATIDQQQEAAARLKEINDQLARLFEESPVGVALGNFADTIDQWAQEFSEREAQIQQVQESAARGRELLISPEQRQSQEIQKQLQDAENAVAENLMPKVRRGLEDLGEQDAIAAAMEDGVMTLEEIGKIFEQFPELRDDLQEDVDTAMQGLSNMRDNLMENSIQAQMARSVENAVLQGPSRAALNASDATTTQGAQELNRLLRGDDAAREADMVEMQKQTSQLEQVNAGIKALAAKLGVAE